MTFYVSIFKESQKLLSTFEFITIQIAETLWYQMTYDCDRHVNVYHSNRIYVQVPVLRQNVDVIVIIRHLL